MTHPLLQSVKSMVLRSKPAQPPVYDWPQLREKLSRPRPLVPLLVDCVRHGQSRGNALGLVTGSWDAPLTKLGREEARTLGSMLQQGYDAAWCSTLRRSRDTLRLALKACGERSRIPIFVDCRLNERALGAMEKQARAFVREYAHGDLYFAPEGGESYYDLTKRVLSFVADLLQQASESNAPQRVLVSTHAGPLRVILGTLYQVEDPAAVLALDFKNTQLCRLDLSGIKWPRFVHHQEYASAC